MIGQSISHARWKWRKVKSYLFNKLQGKQMRMRAECMELLIIMLELLLWPFDVIDLPEYKKPISSGEALKLSVKC